MGAINPNFAYYCPGYYPIGKKSLKCSHRHAPCRNIEEGLTQSCNPYFCQVFRESIEVTNSKDFQNDYDRWYKNICRFGFRRKLGIDLKMKNEAMYPILDITIECIETNGALRRLSPLGLVKVKF
jgi:penicillin-binding protein 2